MATGSGGESADRVAVLDAFTRVLRREAHVLTERPAILWQQVYNRLQWEDSPVAQALTPTMAARSVFGAAPWFRTRTPFVESSALRGIFKGHDNVIEACSFSADGRFVVSASQDNTIRIWNSETLVELRTIEDARVRRACAISTDGRLIVAASGSSIKIWDFHAGRELRTLIGHDEMVVACAISPDGQFIVSASRDKTLKIWEAATGYERRTLVGHKQVPDACAISPDGRTIVSVANLGVDEGGRPISAGWEIILWDATSGQALRTLSQLRPWTARPRWWGIGAGIGTACAFSPDGNLLAFSHRSSNTVQVLDTRNGKLVRTLEGHSRPVNACAFSPDASFIVSASHDRTLRLWNPQTGRELRVLTGSDHFDTCSVGPEGRFIVSGGAYLSLWDLNTKPQQLLPVRHEGQVLAVAASPDGGVAVSASSDQTLRVWDTDTGRCLRTLEGHDAEVRDCAVRPDGSVVVSASNDKTLKLWDVSTGRELRTMTGHMDAVTACAFSPDGGLICSASGLDSIWNTYIFTKKHLLDQTLRLWDADTGRELRSVVGRDGALTACAFSPDGRLICSASGTNEYSHPEARVMTVWETATGRELLTLTGHDDVISRCEFSPDGRFIASTSKDKTIRIWQADTGRELQKITMQEWATGCAFSPDGRFIVSASLTVILWEADTGREIRTLLLPTIGWSVALHPWLPRVICGDVAGSVHLIDLVGIDYGPIIVTARELDGKLSAQCPACSQHVQVNRAQLGEELACPMRGCGRRLRLNQFTLA